MRLNVLLAVLAAAVLAAFAVLYFVMIGRSGDESENGLSIEEQTPSIEQKPDETPTQTAIETPAPERPEESASPENAAEENAAPSDSGESETPTDAPETDAPDAFAVQLQEAVQEIDQLAQDLKDRFQVPNLRRRPQICSPIWALILPVLMRNRVNKISRAKSESRNCASGIEKQERNWTR